MGMGADLEAFIIRVCNRTMDDSLTGEQRTALVQACNQVQWKPHWISGGNYSVCGSWPRALWVARSLGCKKEEGIDWLLVGIFACVSGFIFIVGFVVLICCCRWRKKTDKAAA